MTNNQTNERNSDGLAIGGVEIETDWRIRAMDAAEEGIVITDPRLKDNPIIYVNEGFRKITGYRDEDVLGRNCRFMRGLRTEPAATESIRSALIERKPLTVELVNYRKNGEPFINRLHISPVFWGDELTHFVGIQLDVTELRRAEREALDSKGKLASSAHWAVLGRLASGLAHEINNPMTAALLLSERSRRRLEKWKAEPPSEQEIVKLQDSLSSLESLCRRVTDLVSTFRSLELGPHDEAQAPHTSLASALELAMRRLGDQVAEAGLRITQSGPWGLAAPISTLELVHIFSTIIENALDATEGLVRRELALNATRLGDDRILIECLDSAPRINDEVASCLFRPFFTTKDPGKGVGLGLYVAKTLCEKRGAALRFVRNLTSNIFELDLPLCSAGHLPCQAS